ncbi:RNA-directed DNA polymerase, eukaryota [Tanacetum coccineum]
MNNNHSRQPNKAEKNVVSVVGNKDSGSNGYTNSYIHAVKRGTQFHNVEEDNKPAIVLDESCLNQKDYSTAVMGKVKEFSSLTNLKIFLANEGFENIKLRYMGGYWVMIEFLNKDSKNKFNTNVGIRSWFSHLQQASSTFHIDERVTWVDIEGIPLKAWTKNTFTRIASKWGDLLHVDDQNETYFHSKRICIKTTLVENIFESFKIISKGKVFWVRAKEVSGWMPDFVEDDEEDNDYEDGSIEEGLYSENADKQEEVNSDEGDVEEVSETIFEKEQDQVPKEDNFNIGENGCNSYPPGFTPMTIADSQSNDLKGVRKEGDETLKNDQEEKQNSEVRKPNSINNSKEDREESICSGHFKKIDKPHSGGSMLQFMEDLVKVGQAMRLFGRGEWISNGKKMLIICIYAPQELSKKKLLWDYLIFVIDNWNGEVVIMGDFNAVRTPAERYVSIFNVQGVNAFKSFISSTGLEEVPSGGCSFNWCHKSANKMSKLDRFLISEGLMSSCPNITATTLDRYLSDHRLILLRESHVDYGPIPFRFFHYWFEMEGFKIFVERTWSEIQMTDPHDSLKFMKKMKCLKEKIRAWIKTKKENSYIQKKNLKADLAKIDLLLDKGEGDFDILNKRVYVSKSLQDIEKMESMEMAQKAKIKWAIEGDENSKYYHGILNKKRSQLDVRDILVNNTWIDSPCLVKNEFLSHFKSRFDQAGVSRLHLNIEFHNKLTMDQKTDMECDITRDEIKRSVWDCGIDKSPGPDGFYFGFYRLLCKIIAKILANRLVVVLRDIVNEVQSAFIANRQILDGPFILNEVYQWCKKQKKQTMIFKVDFEKAYDSVCWDYLDDVLKNFGFGDKWRGWIQNSLKSLRGSVIVNGILTNEFQFCRGTYIQLSHLFYADDAVWSDSNIKTIGHVLECFHRASGLCEFSVASVRKMIDDSYLPSVSSKTRWINVVLININIHAWKVKLDCLPTRLNISRRAKEVLVKIANWWDVNYMDLSSYEDWIDWFSNLHLQSKQKKLFEGI